MSRDPDDPKLRREEERVLALAALDPALVQSISRDAGFPCHVAADLAELATAFAGGAGALLLPEDALSSPRARDDLAQLLGTQPAWSDVPIVLIGGAAATDAANAVEKLGNVTALEQPVRLRTLVSALHSAIRARRRQYQMRDQLEAIERGRHQLQESEERLRVALGAAHGGVFDHDFATRRTHWSPELVALYGGALPGAPPSGDRAWLDRLHPDDRDRVEQRIRAALASHGDYTDDYRVVWPDGSIHWLHTRARVVFDDAGAPVRMLGVQLDVTESKRLEQSRALLVGIVESSDDAMITKSLTGIITSWNRGAEHLFGYTADEAIGCSVKLLIPPDRHAEEDEILRRLRAGERIEHYDTIRRTKDGRSIDISLTISAVRDQNGELIGASKVARDITGRKAIERLLRASEAALRETDRRKDEFLAMLAHELRNPLAPIRNAVGLLTAGPAAQSLDRVRDILDRQVGQLSRLIEDLLDVSRISRGQIPLVKEPLQLADIVEMGVETARPLIEQRRHALSVTLPDAPIPIEGDRARLVQVIGNVLANAAKFTPVGGAVAVTAQRVDGEVTISVRDDGIGIAKDALTRVFELFAQEETSLARTQGGLGIGLTLVRDLVALHGGRVELESAGRGTGTEVRVHLPIATDAGDSRASVGPEARPAAGQRILIAEDHRDTADSLRMLLERQGYDVRVTRDGSEAVRAFGEFEPAVALLDIGLPELDGYAVARRIRKNESGPRAVLIALSGYGREEDKRAAKEAGFDHHMTKPVDLRQLVGLFPPR